jgi:tetratricopeptide (TPR) repeat protein
MDSIGSSRRSKVALGTVAVLGLLASAEAHAQSSSRQQPWERPGYQPAPNYRTQESPQNYQLAPAPRTTESPRPAPGPAQADGSREYRQAPSSAAPLQPASQTRSEPQAVPAGAPAERGTATIPGGPDYIRNAIACMNEKRQIAPAAAIKACDSVIDDNIRNLANAYYFRGTATMAQNDFNGAIESYTQAIKLDPTQGEYLAGRGSAYEAKNDLDRALSDYNAAIKADPKAAYAYNSRGATYQRKGDFARAAADYGEVTRLQPNNLDAWSARCWTRAVTPGQTQQALGDCNQALKLKQDSPDALDTRGFVYLKLGQNENAIKDYDAALRLDPKMAGSLYGRGVAKLKKGDQSGGNADIAAAREIKSDIAGEFTKYGIR